MVSVSGLLYTVDKDIKVEPIPWILYRQGKDKTDSRETWFGSGLRPGTVI